MLLLDLASCFAPSRHALMNIFGCPSFHVLLLLMFLHFSRNIDTMCPFGTASIKIRRSYLYDFFVGCDFS